MPGGNPDNNMTYVEAAFSDLANTYKYVRDDNGVVDWNGVVQFAKAAWILAASCWETFSAMFRAFWAWAVGKDTLTDSRIAAFIEG